MESNNLCNYLLDDVEFYKHRISNDRLGIKIYVRYDAQPYCFAMSCKFSMRYPNILMIEHSEQMDNPPLRTVINASEIVSYDFDYDEENEDD